MANGKFLSAAPKGPFVRGEGPEPGVFTFFTPLPPR
jgi:hypothetical protein